MLSNFLFPAYFPSLYVEQLEKFAFCYCQKMWNFIKFLLIVPMNDTLWVSLERNANKLVKHTQTMAMKSLKLLACLFCKNNFASFYQAIRLSSYKLYFRAIFTLPFIHELFLPFEWENCVFYGKVYSLAIIWILCTLDKSLKMT